MTAAQKTNEEMESEAIAAVDPLIGLRLLDRYLVETMIGRGGMSVVYRAMDERLSRPVAVKVFSKLFIADDHVARAVYDHFVQEAFALSRLNHPNTIRIYDLQCLTDAPPHAPFQVSEYLDGGTLWDLVRLRGLLSPGDAVSILEAIGGALTEAHTLGIVHRDVKPSNILFGFAGRQRVIKLADFSVALACRKSAEEVRELLGEATEVAPVSFYSLGWSAPEQIRSDDVGVTADVYALGLTLGFMLCGQRLRDLKTKSDFLRPGRELDAMLEDAVVASNIPVRLASVCLNACRADPAERYATVEAMLAAVRRACRDQSVSPQRPGSRSSSAPPRFSGPEELKALPIQRPSSSGHSSGEAPVDLRGNPDRQGDASEGGIIALHYLDHSAIVTMGRRIRPLLGQEPIDLTSARGTRVRALLLPSEPRRSSIQLRGLNCFLTRPGGQPTPGLSVDEDIDLGLMGPDRSPVGELRIRLGLAGEPGRVFRLRGLRLSVSPEAVDDAVCLEFDDDTDLHLIHRKHRP